MKNISYKQLTKQLKTWKRDAPQQFKEIKQLASQYGLIGKRGNVIKGKSKKTFESFTKAYQNKFGSYTSFKKKYSVSSKQLQKYGLTHGSTKEFYNILGVKSKQEYINKTREYNELMSQMWNEFDSKQAREEMIYIEESGFSLSYMIDRLKEELSKESLLPPIDVNKYVEQYGTLNPPQSWL